MPSDPAIKKFNRWNRQQMREGKRDEIRSAPTQLDINNGDGNVYLPSHQEIQQATAALKRTWSPEEREARRRRCPGKDETMSPATPPWSTPEVSTNYGVTRRGKSIEDRSNDGYDSW